MNLVLQSLIKEEVDRTASRKRDRDIYLRLYSGKVYTDTYLIECFPIKYNTEKRLAQLKELLFFLASSYNISDVKKNHGIYFTRDTFSRCGIKINNAQTMHNWLEGLKRCGIIWIVNNHYQFAHGEDNFSKLYGVNNLGIIKSFPAEYKEYLNSHVVKKAPDSTVKISNNISCDIFSKKQKSIVNSGLTKFNNSIVYDFNKESLVDYTKGTIDEFSKMLDEYNEGKTEYNKKSIRFKYENNKITGRAYSNYIATEKDDVADGYYTDRTEWCKENNLNYRFDIKSAVPRISHLLCTGEWKSNDYDFYEEMSKRSGLGFPREYMKHIHMRLRFSPSAEKSFYEFIYSNKDIIKKRYPNGEPYEYYLQHIKPNLMLDWRKLYGIVESLEGSDHSSSVFYFESFLELYVVWKLKKMGVTAYNIYDEFYFDKPCNIESIIAEAANYMFKRIGEYDDRFSIRKRCI